MALLRHHDVIRLRGTGSRTRTCDWLGGHAGGYLLQHSAKSAFLCPNHVLLPFGRRRFRWRRLPRRDEIIPLPSKLRGYFFDPYARCCRCSVGCSLGRKGCVSRSHPFERFHRCPWFDNALLLTPVAWRNGLGLLMG